MKHLIPVLNTSLRRDITTTVTKQVPAHELQILHAVHGRDNVYPGKPTTDVAHIDPSGEFDRLCRVYGVEVVEAVFGTLPEYKIEKLVTEASQGEAPDDSAGIRLEGPDSEDESDVSDQPTKRQKRVAVAA